MPEERNILSSCFLKINDENLLALGVKNELFELL